MTVAGPRTIDEYVAALPPSLAEAAAAARAVIDRELQGGSGAIRWGHPAWSLDDDPVCFLRATDGELLLGFWHGMALDDPSGRLESGGTIMAHARLRSAADVDDAVIAAWLRQARELTLAERRDVT